MREEWDAKAGTGAGDAGGGCEGGGGIRSGWLLQQQQQQQQQRQLQAAAAAAAAASAARLWESSVPLFQQAFGGVLTWDFRRDGGSERKLELQSCLVLVNLDGHRA